MAVGHHLSSFSVKLAEISTSLGLFRGGSTKNMNAIRTTEDWVRTCEKLSSYCFIWKESFLLFFDLLSLPQYLPTGTQKTLRLHLQMVLFDAFEHDENVRLSQIFLKLGIFWS